jgi:steroid delta-isomerase-like uncharacterized protein
MSKKFVVLIGVAFLLILAGCAPGVSSEEYDSVVTELTQVTSELNGVEQELEQARQQLLAAQESTADTERVAKDYLEAWNSHDVDKIASFFTDDGVYEDVALGVAHRGKKELKDFFKSMFVSFPDLKIELKSTVLSSTGDWTASEWVMSGTFAQSSIPGVPATGKSFSVRGASVTEYRDGKMSRNTDYWSLASFLQQVGLMP